MKRAVLVAILLCFGLSVFCFPQGRVLAQEKKTTPKSAEGYAVMEVSSGRLLDCGDENKKLPMASTTKIITAILVIMNQPNLDKMIEIPKEACGIEGSSIFLKAGEHLSVRELLFGLMLKSGNDAAVALALDTFGSIEEYQKQANLFCKKVGATNTHIVTPHGLHDKNHYTTAKDLATITCFALKNQTFREIVGTKLTSISNELGKSPRYLKNKNKMLSNFDGATGVKTGFTKAAGRCLVSSAKRDNMELVCVVLNCHNWFEESSKLLEKAFSKYKMYEILPEHYHIGKYACKYGNKSEINLVSSKGFCYPLTEIERSQIRKDVVLPRNILAPVKKNQTLGKIDIYLKNDLIFSEKIYSIEDSISMRMTDIFTRLFEDMLF